jgi:small subunit ribosomal protein S6
LDLFLKVLQRARSTSQAAAWMLANKGSQGICGSARSLTFAPQINRKAHDQPVRNRLHLTPVLSEDQTKEAVKKFKDLILAGSGKVHHEESWGMRKLAYPIQKKSTGFYHLIEFESEPALVAKLETEYRRDERVIRFLTIVMDKHHIAFAEKRRHQAQLSKKETVEPTNA